MILRTTPAALESAAALADSVADLLTDRHLAAAGQMVELLDAGWKGAGADACRAAWEAWDSGFRRIITGLGDESDALRLAAAAYAQTDSGAADDLAGRGHQF